MKILLLGPDGQVGWELQRALAPLGGVIALGRHGPDGLVGDLAQPSALAATARRLRPDVIVNAAAYTAVDRAEQDPATAFAVNGEAPGVLAGVARELDAWLLHYSTDYVFDGSGSRPWTEDDVPRPLSVYGRSKRAGEEAILGSGCRHLILRTSWVHAARGDNFAHTMLRLAAERERLRVVGDQVGAPTGAELIADVSAHVLRAALARPELGGLYHLAAGGETSWCGYARHVIARARDAGRALAVTEIEAIPSAAYPTPAPRPLNSRLDTARLRERFGLVLPDWTAGVDRMLAEIL